MADNLKILSAGAVKPALTRVIDAFQRDHHIQTETAFATAPAILERMKTVNAIDVLIAPDTVLDDLMRSGKCAPDPITLIGRIGVGVLVRSGRAPPPIASVEDLTRALLAARSVVYNRASTGTYLEKLFESLGVAEAIRGKSIRYPDFGAVLDHILHGGGDEIGFGATTVIIENQKLGVQFAGALPAEVQNYTTYTAAAIAPQDRLENARQFVRYLAGPVAKGIFVSAGID